MRSVYIIAFIFLRVVLSAQKAPSKISIGTSSIGLSAVSINTITAKSYRALYPFYNYGTDSASGFFLFSTRQKTEGGTQYLSKGFIGCLDMVRDTIEWLFESNYYEIEQSGKDLFFSNEQKTTKYNKLHGFVDVSYPAKFVCILPSEGLAFAYNSPEKDLISCINIADGLVDWNASIPGTENWVDVLETGDSLLLIAAAGLHAVEPKTGLKWSYPLATSTKVDKALTYSLANNNQALRKISKVTETSKDENSVTELSSNILEDDKVVYFAGKEKLIAVNIAGKLLWELDLKEYPVSKMQLLKRGGSLVLVNFGLAKYADNYVIYGNPFVLNVNVETGKINYRNDLSSIDNLVDYTIIEKSMIFAGKTAILEVHDGSDKVETLLSLDVPLYGSFAGFVDGDRYYTEKEGFYVSLNFINDNLIYFKADNNKIYGLEKGSLSYAYHFSDIYKMEIKFDNKLILANEDKTLVVSSNFDLLCTLDLTDKPVVLGKRIFFVGDRIIYSLDADDIK